MTVRLPCVWLRLVPSLISIMQTLPRSIFSQFPVLNVNVYPCQCYSPLTPQLGLDGRSSHQHSFLASNLVRFHRHFFIFPLFNATSQLVYDFRALYTHPGVWRLMTLFMLPQYRVATTSTFNVLQFCLFSYIFLFPKVLHNAPYLRFVTVP